MERYRKKAVLEYIDELITIIDDEIDSIDCRPHNEAEVLRYWKSIADLKLQLEHSKIELEKENK